MVYPLTYKFFKLVDSFLCFGNNFFLSSIFFHLISGPSQDLQIVNCKRERNIGKLTSSIGIGIKLYVDLDKNGIGWTRLELLMSIT